MIEMIDAIQELKDAEERRWARIVTDLWTSGTPVALWPDEGGGGDDEEEENNPPEQKPKDEEDDEDKEESEVKKAYGKLNESEKEVKRLKAQLAKAERQGMSDADKVKAELDEARAQAGMLQDQMDERDRNDAIKEVAGALKLKRSDDAKFLSRFVDADSKDERDIRRDLKAALKDFPELAKDPTPTPDVDPPKGKTRGHGQMNDFIRQSMGR